MAKYVSAYFNNELPPKRVNQHFVDQALRSIQRYHGDGIERSLRRVARHIRPYSSFFKWAPRQKGVEELGVTRTFIEAVSGPPADFVSIRPQVPDPPDVVGERADGREVAIELAELIDEQAVATSVAAVRKGAIQKVVHRMWDQPSLIVAVDALLREKDKKGLEGGPYTEYIILLYTDEYMLSAADARHWLDGCVFQGLTQATEAYLLLSYDPVTDSYPYIALTLAKR